MNKYAYYFVGGAVAVLLVGVVWYFFDAQKNVAPQVETAERETFIIEELGLSLPLTDELKDIGLTYSITDFGTENGKYAKLTSASLVEASRVHGESGCSYGALGSLGLQEQGSGRYVPNGYYSSPHDRCSVIDDVRTLQYLQISHLVQALKAANMGAVR